MAEYDIDFGRKLAETARIVLELGAGNQESIRTIIYLSLLSTEISLKAVLEKAGVKPANLRTHGHHLDRLLFEISKCEIEREIVPGGREFVAATSLRSVSIPHENAAITVGSVIERQKVSASKYPNEIRYGEDLRHFPPGVLVGLAAAVAIFATEHWDSIRLTDAVQP